MKIAVVGKGGAGKTTLSAALARRWAGSGRRVIAVDADPDGNLGSALGVSYEDLPPPISQMRDLVLQRTGAGSSGGAMFRLNPEVDDLPAKFCVYCRGVRLLVMGTVESGGKGCMCPEATVLKALLQHLLLYLPDDVVLDMEAGLEHLGRASARGVDAMLSVVEPGMRSVQTAARVRKLATEIGIRRTYVVANRIREPHELETLRRALDGQTFLGAIPYCPELIRADLEGRPADVEDRGFLAAIDAVDEALAREMKGACKAVG